ncbi:hypothetical protein BGW38_010753 [Lunasporangiospora selenospora]|uniref:Ricin B lectin domain-containing protein n=1 Tax=Lunasporangiospora selenospora TaxID=979761 RepID=A0A9P6FWI7_9FUNG|nr:hypothetical protein BGW38_010753 [Lunasporangiospora selenospora]
MVRSTALFIATLVIIIQVCIASYLPNGIYQIALRGGQLTDLGQGPDGEIALLPPKNNYQAQLWRISSRDNAVIIQNFASHLYISGRLHPGEPLRLSRAPTSWKLTQAFDESLFIETVGQYNGEHLVVDVSGFDSELLAILAKPRKTEDQAWSFHHVGGFYEEPRQYRLPYNKAGLCH